MEIKTDRQRLLRESDELIGISRELRRCGAQIEDVKARLAGYTQLDGCKREIVKQEDAVESLTAKLVLLSAALQDIANVYGRTEQKNIEILEGYVSPFVNRSQVWVSAIPDRVIEQFNKMLY